MEHSRPGCEGQRASGLPGLERTGYLVLDWGSKKVAGWHLSTISKTADWLAPLSTTIYAQFPNGRDGAPQLLLVSDHGCQPTSTSFMAACRALDLCQVFTTFKNP